MIFELFIQMSDSPRSCEGPRAPGAPNLRDHDFEIGERDDDPTPVICRSAGKFHNDPSDLARVEP